MLKASADSAGRLVALALKGAWRPVPPALELSASELDRIAPQLLKSGAGALGWRRARHSGLPSSSALAELHQAYRLHSLQALMHEQEIEQLFKLLNAAGVEPLLVKGWWSARLYPEKGLRPYGDIDLCVRPAQFAAARTALKAVPELQCAVDLHCGFEKFGGAKFDELAARALSFPFGEASVRVPCAEDHLRILCVHMLREGAWRPLWLCDIAAAVETRAADFDWSRCLTEDRRLGDWIRCALRLAQQLLGADIYGTPAAERARALPQWLVPVILKEWGASLSSMSQRHRVPVSNFLRHPVGVLKGLPFHWPNPIEATIGVRAPFNDLPRLPFQLGNCLARTAKFAARLPKTLRREVAPEK
jgi:Uncharacterised nucleotidyltransferase